jgi:hypothetical protein
VAKKRKRKYSPSAGRDAESEMRRYKRGTAKSGLGRALEGAKEGRARAEEETLAVSRRTYPLGDAVA